MHKERRALRLDVMHCMACDKPLVQGNFNGLCGACRQAVAALTRGFDMRAEVQAEERYSQDICDALYGDTVEDIYDDMEAEDVA